MTKWIVPYGGRDWVLDDDRLTASETRLHKALTGGMTPDDGDRARLARDGDAWVAVLVLARQRTGMSREEAVRVEPDEVDAAAALVATAEAADRAMRDLRSSSASVDQAADAAPDGQAEAAAT